MSGFCVEFRGVSKSYGDTVVLRDLDLALPVDATTAVVGESGSGKSTLMQVINGLVRPEAGVVSVLGAALDYDDLPRTRRRMGYAVQGAGLFPHLTAVDNIALVASMEGWSRSRIDDRLIELMALLELPEDLAARYPHALSGGQQQRVSLCRAMMLDPPLMLLDEPFSALDPITRAAIHDEFIKLQQVAARSVVMVTHDMSEAVKLAQHLVILKDGEVVREGALDAVMSDPGNEYVTRLFEVSR